MRRSEIEKLPTVSIRGVRYVQIDALVEAIKAEEEQAKAAEPEERAVPRRVEKDKA